MSYIPLADQEIEMHHPQTWIGKWLFSQDHKVIAIQYIGTFY
jgi:cytochrome c oxidase subunit I